MKTKRANPRKRFALIEKMISHEIFKIKKIRILFVFGCYESRKAPEEEGAQRLRRLKNEKDNQFLQRPIKKYQKTDY